MHITPFKIRWRNRFYRYFPHTAAFIERIRFLRVHLKRYEQVGLTLPLPGLLKRAILLRVAREQACEALVETGTYLGDTPWQLRRAFKEIHTIEVNPELAGLARERFQGYPYIHAHEGDSGKLLFTVVPGLQSPTLFWLDGHYSAGITGRAESDCPIFEELRAIFELSKTPYAILIDDARCFGVDQDYPTIEALEKFILKHNNRLTVRVENDIIFVLPLPKP